VVRRQRDCVPNRSRAFIRRREQTWTSWNSSQRSTSTEIRRHCNLDALQHAIHAQQVASHPLFEIRETSKRNYCNLIFARLNYLFDEQPRCSFLIGQGGFLRATDVDQKRDGQRPVRFTLEGEELLRHTIFEHANVFCCQCRDEAALLVHGGEGEVRDVGFSSDYVVLIRSLRQYGDTEDQNQEQDSFHCLGNSKPRICAEQMAAHSGNPMRRTRSLNLG